MAKRKEQSIFALLLAAPPWAGIVVAVGIWIFAWFIFDYIHLPGWQNKPLITSLDTAIHQPALRQFSWLFIALCLAGSVGSFFRGKHRAELLDRQQGIESIRNLTWQAFERLVAEAYQRLGFIVTENGQHGPDGGVDLFLRKNGRTTIVQCKQWRSMSVGAPIVREMYGLMRHHNADEVKIVCVGHFTSEAIAFSRGKAVELVSGAELLRLVQTVQSGQRAVAQPSGFNDDIAPASLPLCPKCGGKMVMRTERESKEQFFGCTAFPKCRGVRQTSHATLA